MTNTRDWYDPGSDGPASDIEALVRAAGGYVQASDDLRPRVLESARMQCGEQRAQRCLRQVAVFLILVALFTTSDSGRRDLPENGRQVAFAMADARTIFVQAETNVARSGDFGWGLVDAFTDVRRRQSEVLRLAL